VLGLLHNSDAAAAESVHFAAFGAAATLPSDSRLVLLRQMRRGDPATGFRYLLYILRDRLARHEVSGEVAPVEIPGVIARDREVIDAEYTVLLEGGAAALPAALVEDLKARVRQLHQNSRLTGSVSGVL
jgi:hypothetical protein